MEGRPVAAGVVQEQRSWRATSAEETTSTLGDGYYYIKPASAGRFDLLPQRYLEAACWSNGRLVEGTMH